VFAGTTNNEGGEFLRDPTGFRRFWPVQVGSVDIDGLEAVRDQLWGEAVAMYQAGVPWWLTEPEAVQLAQHNLQYQSSDPWAGPVVRYLEGPPKIESCTISDLLTHAVGVDLDKQHKGHQMRIGGVMTELGWIKTRGRRGGSVVRLWKRPEE
jgi:predicted P-loop ATPase